MKKVAGVCVGPNGGMASICDRGRAGFRGRVVDVCDCGETLEGEWKARSCCCSCCGVGGWCEEEYCGGCQVSLEGAVLDARLWGIYSWP